MEELEYIIADLNFNNKDYDYDYKKFGVSIKNNKNIGTIQQYSGIIILFQEERIEIEISSKGNEVKTTHLWIQDYAFDMTTEFKNAVDKIPYDKDCYSVLSALFTKFIYDEDESKKITDIYLVNKKTQGGKKAVVKYTVKQLQAIASKNNIKITKKVDGKTVRLNKQGLIAKLKRYKVL